MIRITTIFGALLVLLGVGFYVALQPVHWTVLLPALFGLVLLVCASLARLGPAWRKHAMHVAMLVALLGAIGAAMRLPRLFGEQGALAAVSIEHLLMVLLCLVYVGLGVRSFVAARRGGGDAGPAEPG